MQRLPRLPSPDAAGWCLPLPDALAGELTQILLIDDLAARKTWLSELMATDPALVLWSVIRAGRWQFEPPAGLGPVASWLSDAALTVFQWSRDELRELPEIRHAERRIWCELNEASVDVARRVATGGDADRAYVLGLVHNADGWLRSCGPAIPTGESPLLPTWLSRWPGRLAARIELGPAERRVADALDPAASLRRDESWRRPIRARWSRQTQLGFDAALPLLVNKLNRLTALQVEFDERLETEKLEAMRELAYGASHEINNPLANISSRAQTLLRDETDPERRRKLAAINAQAFRAHEMIADMMLFAKPPLPELVLTDLVRIVAEVIGELEAEAAEQGTSIHFDAAAETLELSADPHQLGTALSAVVRNAFEALRSGGRVEVSAGWSSEERQEAWIAVHDSGPGIPDAVRRHLFDPFYSGREAGRGLGLGLSKCWAIIQAHGGRIHVQSSPDSGTRCVMSLPVTLDTHSTKPLVLNCSEPAQGSE